MRIIQPASGMSSQAALVGTQGQSVPASAFQSRLSPSAGASSSAPGGPLPSGGDILQNTFQEMRGMLRLQYELSRGTTTLISNVLKTRHETAKNSIQNIR